MSVVLDCQVQLPQPEIAEILKAPVEKGLDDSLSPRYVLERNIDESILRAIQAAQTEYYYDIDKKHNFSNYSCSIQKSKDAK